MPKTEQRVIEEIRNRNAKRITRQKENKQYQYYDPAQERKRTKPSPIQDIETLLKILDGKGE